MAHTLCVVVSYFHFLVQKIIGGSQGKYGSAPEVMAKTGNQPRLLTAVMEAIANLKEGSGSTQKRIIDQVQCLLSANKMTFRNPVVHIKKALRHGVQTGLIKQKAGKFRLGLDSKDYAIFKNFQKLRKKKELPLREHRRRRKRSRRRRRRRRRRSASSPDEDASASGSASGSLTGANIKFLNDLLYIWLL